MVLLPTFLHCGLYVYNVVHCITIIYFNLLFICKLSKKHGIETRLNKIRGICNWYALKKIVDNNKKFSNYSLELKKIYLYQVFAKRHQI